MVEVQECRRAVILVLTSTGAGAATGYSGTPCRCLFGGDTEAFCILMLDVFCVLREYRRNTPAMAPACFSDEQVVGRSDVHDDIADIEAIRPNSMEEGSATHRESQNQASKCAGHGEDRDHDFRAMEVPALVHFGIHLLKDHHGDSGVDERHARRGL
jgi:hypothetical protein